MSEQKDKCPGWQGEECWYDKELKRYVVTGWDSNETCPTCNGTGEKRLDGPDGGKDKLKEKIALIACSCEEKPCPIYCPCPFFEKEVDQIIALFPDIEELMKTNKELGLKLMEYSLKHKEDLLEAKREERERIINDSKDSLELIIRFMNMPEAKKDITDALRITLRDMMIGTWQALKEEKVKNNE